MNTFIDTAVTITYRGYEIRDVSNAINPMTGTRGVGGERCIIKKGGKILKEQPSIELAKKYIDEYEGGEIEGKVPSDWQAGGSKAGWETDL